MIYFGFINHDGTNFTLKLAKEFFRSKGVARKVINKVKGVTVIQIHPFVLTVVFAQIFKDEVEE